MYHRDLRFCACTLLRFRSREQCPVRIYRCSAAFSPFLRLSYAVYKFCPRRSAERSLFLAEGQSRIGFSRLFVNMYRRPVAANWSREFHPAHLLDFHATGVLPQPFDRLLQALSMSQLQLAGLFQLTFDIAVQETSHPIGHGQSSCVCPTQCLRIPGGTLRRLSKETGA